MSSYWLGNNEGGIVPKFEVHIDSVGREYRMHKWKWYQHGKLISSGVSGLKGKMTRFSIVNFVSLGKQLINVGCPKANT